MKDKEFIETMEPVYRAHQQQDNLSEFTKRYWTKFKGTFRSQELGYLFLDKLTEFSKIFSKCTGSSSHHHAFRGGLLVHTFEMLDLLHETFVKNTYNAKRFNYKKCPQNDFFRFDECAVAILYHDWGKIFEYDNEKGPNEKGRWNVTKMYKTLGHIFLSAHKFMNDAKQYGLPNDQIERITHSILAHHTKHEWGSPVVPFTPEARIVCACDLISSQVANNKSDYYEAFVSGQVEYKNSIDIYENICVPYVNGSK